MAGKQPNHLRVLQDFQHWLQKITVTYTVTSEDGTVENYSFVPQAAVESKFKHDDYSFAQGLRDAVVQFERHTIMPRDIAENCPRIFCILLILNQGEYISEFLRDDTLHDALLPFLSRPANFPIVYEDFFTEFDHRQWEFCATVMKNMNDIKVKDERILPYISRHMVSDRGVSATIDKVEIHKDYDQLYRRTDQV